MKPAPTLLYLIRVFLYLGFTAFGGYTALVAMVRKKLVEEDQVIDDQLIMDSITIASVLPGPLAVNITTYIGYYLRGWPGALLSMLAVLSPSVILMIVLAELQDVYSSIPIIELFLEGVTPVISAIILSVAYKMAVKNIKKSWHWVVFALVLISSFLFRGYFVFIVILLLSGAVGAMFGEDIERRMGIDLTGRLKSVLQGTTLLITVVVAIGLLLGSRGALLATFAKISLTLFGGGYVMIPVLFDIVVTQQSWLADWEFAQAISFGQITPGPILVSATFVGYRVDGLLGALSATIGIFLPAALLMIVVGVLYQKFSQLKIINKVLAGIRPAIIAYITFSVTMITPFERFDWFVGAAILTSLVLMIRYNVSFFWLLIGFGTLRAIFF